MKFFKLELINREQNFNKTFNANPSVGVLDPLAKKVRPNRVRACPCAQRLAGSSMLTRAAVWAEIASRRP
jgi:hypothetical protein